MPIGIRSPWLRSRLVALPVVDVPGNPTHRARPRRRAHILDPRHDGMRVRGDQQLDGGQLITHDLRHLDSLLDPLIAIKGDVEGIDQLVESWIRPATDVLSPPAVLRR